MATSFIQYTPIVSARGKVVHVVTLRTPQHTACGKACSGWRVALDHVDCVSCKAAIVFPVKVQRKKRREVAAGGRR